jgi:hypothetical protein
MLVDGKEVIVRGRLVKIAELKEEWDENIHNPEAYVEQLKRSSARAQIFSFVQRLPDSKPRFNYYMEWDSVAAIPIKSYEYWLKHLVVKNSRKKIGYAIRKGVELRPCKFNDELVQGILEMYHEVPIMQGKPNRQYKTDFAKAKKLNATFLDRAQFIGAFYKSELIGYIKLVNAGNYMRTMGILSKYAHRDKGPMNLLIAKAVELCAEQKIPYLVYAKFNYGKRGSATLKKFKKNLGFESIILPRYYIPMNLWGKIILHLKMHRDPVEYLPEMLIRLLIKFREYLYLKKAKMQSSPL